MSTSAPESTRRTWWSRARLAATGAALLVAVILVAAARSSREPEVVTATGSVSNSASADSLVVSASEYVGWKNFDVHCSRCHGVDAVGGQLAPDLRISFSPQGLNYTPQAFALVVNEGRPERGMPAWNTMLSVEQIQGLYDYLKARSQRRLPPGRPRADSVK